MHFGVFDYRHVMQNQCWMWLPYWKRLYFYCFAYKITITWPKCILVCSITIEICVECSCLFENGCNRPWLILEHGFPQRTLLSFTSNFLKVWHGLPCWTFRCHCLITWLQVLNHDLLFSVPCCFLLDCLIKEAICNVMVDHLQSRVTPWRQYASHVKVRGTLSKMDVTSQSDCPFVHLSINSRLPSKVIMPGSFVTWEILQRSFFGSPGQSSCV